MGSKIWKNGRKTTIMGKIRGVVPVPIVFYPPVPVPVPMLCFDQCSFLAITWSFVIRFEGFKLIIKLESRTTKHPEIGTFKFGFYVAQKFTQSRAMFKPISDYVFKHRVVRVV